MICPRNFFYTYLQRSASPTVTSTRSLQFKRPRNETTRAVAQVLLTVSGSLSLGVDDRGGGVICQHPCLTRVVRASRFTPAFRHAVVLHPGVQCCVGASPRQIGRASCRE